MRIHNAPIKEIMPYVDVVIHHGGLGTASEAVAFGIPQLIMPDMVDRPDNASRLRKLGVAKVFPIVNWKAEMISEALKEITDNKILSLSCEKLAEKIKNDNPREELCLNVKKLSENGAKYQVSSSCDINLNDKNIIDNEIITNRSLSLDSMSEEKKKLLVALLKKKRK
jgi:hypothetical protein